MNTPNARFVALAEKLMGLFLVLTRPGALNAPQRLHTRMPLNIHESADIRGYQRPRIKSARNYQEYSLC